MGRAGILLVAALMLVGAGAADGATLVGPTPYLSEADSPFTPGGTFHREDFEDNALNTPGVTPSTGSPTGPGDLTDSVDGDDGAIDGSGTAGHSFFTGAGSTGITFTFDPMVLGSFPTAAGIVWTDGEGAVTFEAFDALGASLGTIGPAPINDGSISGTSAEDRFFGVYEAGGISAIFISNAAGGIEVDHLQYGAATLVTTTTTLGGGSTTTTTVSGGDTTTTTTLPDGCAGVPSGPTFASLNCRLSDLIARVAVVSELGASRQARIGKALDKAKLRKEGAETRCLESQLPRVKGQLIKATERVIGAKKTLGQPDVRRNVPPALREELVALLEGLVADLRTLRRNVRCPDDAD